MSVQDLIAGVGDRLTPTERRIAEVVSADATLLAFGTVSDLAERAGTSRPSIVRFAAKLGFSGYSELQAWVREGVSRQLSSPSARIRRLGGGGSADIRSGIADAVQRVFDALDAERLAALAAPLVAARRVWVLSGETSMAGARVLQSGLSMVRSDVHLVHEHSVGRDLCSAAPGDVAVVFDFARYRRSSVTAARALADLGVTIVAMTDGPLSPLASITHLWCELRVPAVGPFDSSVPAVTAAELLIAQVVNDLGDRARDRIDQLEALWRATGTFVDDAARPPLGRRE
ncbi:MAG: MurR/RpiR family transcriptional regulator [Phycisphaerales bacterium JB054]